ncbi:uncharacterized protein LOC105698548 [Orussus abietinus]|uniref:uncharacterized protein LOC105698548 n=1 Tax=Orussus abietinus TaxID=222816 RepID=UPI000625F86E|nr:uncharacterized protein LOC105698548 [Orussus abietinus]
MTNLLETFVTNTHADYTWPYPKPLMAKPAQPPMNPSADLHIQRFHSDGCKCTAEGFQTDTNGYKTLADKEQKSREGAIAENRKVDNSKNRILQNVCHMGDEAMRSVYQIDYEKRGVLFTEYKQLMAAVDSPVGAPICSVNKDLKNGYKDPTKFRHSAVDKPHIRPPRCIDMSAVPKTFELWAAPFTGYSEYMDTISKMGLSNMKNRQQYLQPLPTSRK